MRNCCYKKACVCLCICLGICLGLCACICLCIFVFKSVSSCDPGSSLCIRLRKDWAHPRLGNASLQTQWVPSGPWWHPSDPSYAVDPQFRWPICALMGPSHGTTHADADEPQMAPPDPAWPMLQNESFLMWSFGRLVDYGHSVSVSFACRPVITGVGCVFFLKNLDTLFNFNESYDLTVSHFRRYTRRKQ